MPSPIGHALGGIAAGVLVSGRPAPQHLTLFVLAGVAADIDFLLPLPHRGPSHSIGAALLCLAVAFVSQRIATTRRRSALPSRPTLGLGAAYGSHVLLDWLGADSSTPVGLMALWPFSQTFYISGLDIFNSVNRRYWLAGFWWANTVAVIRELLILGPLAWLVVRRPGSSAEPTDTGRTPGRSCAPGDPPRPSA